MFKIPYLDTRIETDFLVTLLLTPLWTLLGLNVVIYHAVAFLAFAKWVISTAPYEKDLSFPRPLFWFGLFLCFYFLSILINMGNYPKQRILASFNNFSVFVMGLFVVWVIFNCRSNAFLLGVLRVGHALCLITGIISAVCLALWFSGMKRLYSPALLGYLWPGLMSYPYFSSLMNIHITDSDWLTFSVPRINFYGGSPTATGGLMLMLFPLMAAHHVINSKNKILYLIKFSISFLPLFLSLSRTALCAFVGASILVPALEKRRHFFLSLLGLAAAVFASNSFYDGIVWLFRLRGPSSQTRIQLYQDAIQTVMEQNPLMGIGVKLREGFTMMAIGSHSTLIGLFLVTGMIGLSLFILFQLSTIKNWYGQKKLLANNHQRAIWKYLGMSFIGINIWLITDSLDALPHVAFCYFVITGCILAFPFILVEEDAKRASAVES